MLGPANEPKIRAGHTNPMVTIMFICVKYVALGPAVSEVCMVSPAPDQTTQRVSARLRHKPRQLY